MMYSALTLSLMLGGANGLVVGTPATRLTIPKIAMAGELYAPISNKRTQMIACLLSLTHIAVTRYYTVYAVHHTFKRGKADTFWEDMADADLPAMAKL